MEKFKELNIGKSILQALQEEGFETPTEIQEKSIPSAIAGKDLLAGSATGSGKTLAFGAGIIQNSVKGNGIQALILTPTRELAQQVKEALKKFSKHKPLTISAVYGGMPIDRQFRRLRIADIVVGTPGRVLDHIKRKTIKLNNVKTLVLDEADRMLDMGFIDDVERIIKSVPNERQTLLFSATIHGMVANIIEKYLNDPVKIEVQSHVDPAKLIQGYYDVPDQLKFSLLVHLLKAETSGLVMVFCNTRHNTDFVANNLKGLGIPAEAIHGGFTQGKRNKILERFHSQKVLTLVCTDVAARGLDIPNISHVYNYDLPIDPKDYVHRIGRTARAGKEGIAVNILASRDHDNFGRVLKENKIKIPKLEMPRIERIELNWRAKPKKFGGGGGSGGGRGRRR
ncbi:DEAD/DEAH box helicase [Candidatus Woesearchaeota archaeon]|jgi:ATP-dependent RNA helicase DeaD|nr:DEAD/DEAH box helicase [Candidatus Woesearchaeota archaeon]MBT4835482.1 DEAD/DEAH box helicase [Candidatus Woesearchaeota archaeon]MBT6734826.1 DEAD/DEAH box helicase [Candidatus Woesearchaeota archaeon]MBT7169839.1 DEAD/DEAH box helicase [Candidatus Woesearchaeota archaeon]MBT7474617.1 DEAD/DEAH box helicase [Candidatus Woesearchaeota archaeon]